MRPIFIRIPKTGSLSILNAIGDNIYISKHRSAKWVQEHYKEDWRNRFTFSFVRNPWDAFVSTYFFRFKEFAEKDSMYDFRSQIRRMLRRKPFKKGVHNRSIDQVEFLDQFAYISDENDEICVDFVGRFENLQDDVNHLCKELDLEEVSLGHFNKTDHLDYRYYYDDDLAELVGKCSEDLIDTFGYEF
jgi:hypothetical protein